jgi:uncharacterized membrane protein YdbT with pleckstrin-like domain
MSYLDRRLLPDEWIVAKAGLHWITLAGSGVVLLIAAAVVGLTLEWPRSPGYAQVWFMGRMTLFLAAVLFIARLVHWLTAECVLTNKRVVVKTGWLRRDVIEIPLRKIEGVQLHQPVIGRLLGYASLVVSGLGGTRELQRHIASPVSFHQALQQQLDLAA